MTGFRGERRTRIFTPGLSEVPRPPSILARPTAGGPTHPAPPARSNSALADPEGTPLIPGRAVGLKDHTQRRQQSVVSPARALCVCMSSRRYPPDLMKLPGTQGPASSSTTTDAGTTTGASTSTDAVQTVASTQP
jgi:hypothetical protein